MSVLAMLNVRNEAGLELLAVSGAMCAAALCAWAYALAARRQARPGMGRTVSNQGN
ncbi:hypothetical protein ACTJNK_01655 [Achromobacter anxifer]